MIIIPNWSDEDKIAYLLNCAKYNGLIKQKNGLFKRKGVYYELCLPMFGFKKLR